MARKTIKKQSSRPAYLWWGIGAILLVAIGLLAWRSLSAPAAAAVPTTTAGFAADVSVEQAQALVEEGAFLLDVRTQEEWNQIHVPGAVLIPLDELPNRVSEVPQDQEVVVICRTGNRSQAGRDILTQAGHEQVTSVNGGIVQWQSAGFPTVSGP